MDKLHKEIAKKLFIISNDILADYYGISPHPWKIEEVLLKNHKGASWTPNGWTIPVGLNLEYLELSRVPTIANIGVGGMRCGENKLTTLQGCPEYASTFKCNNNRLQSLVGGPSFVGHDYSCTHNKLLTLHGSPEKIPGNFFCGFNLLVNLEKGPKWVKEWFACENNRLVTLKGAPQKVLKSFFCENNQLKNLENGPEYIGGHLHCMNNPFEETPPFFGGVIKGQIIHRV